MIKLWTIIYWLSFLGTWFVLPFFQEYFNSRKKTLQGRMRDSIKTNLIFYLILGGIFFLVLLCFIIQGKMADISVLQLMGGLSNCL